METPSKVRIFFINVVFIFDGRMFFQKGTTFIDPGSFFMNEVYI